MLQCKHSATCALDSLTAQLKFLFLSSLQATHGLRCREHSPLGSAVHSCCHLVAPSTQPSSLQWGGHLMGAARAEGMCRAAVAPFVCSLVQGLLGARMQLLCRWDARPIQIPRPFSDGAESELPVHEQNSPQEGR